MYYNMTILADIDCSRQRQMRVYEVHGGKNLESVDFLCKDLRWKANIIRNRVACLHRETKLHSNWGRTHVSIAEIAMEAVEQARSATTHE